MNPVTITGILAAIFTTISFVPQAVQIIRTKHTASISLNMYLIFTIGTALWLTYGILSNNIPVILANGITLILAVIILYYKLRYK